jgi:hypothetical protein
MTRRKGLDMANKRRWMDSLYRHNCCVDMAMKMERKQCADCGLAVTEHNSIAFDWDHIDRTTKFKEVSKLRNGSTLQMLNEIAKCALRCAICHRIKTYVERENEPAFTAENTQMSLF